MAPSKPSFKTKPPIKPKGPRTKGIVREARDKVTPLSDISSENGSQKVDQRSPGQLVQKSVNVGDKVPSSEKLNTNVKKCLKLILSDFKTHEKLLSQLKSFVIKESVTRREIVTLGDTVAAYTELNDIEVRVVRQFKTLCDVAKITEAEAEASSVYIKPSTVDSMLEESAKILDSVVAKFRAMKDNYADTPQVTNYLDFVNPASSHKAAQLEGEPKSKVDTSSQSCGGIEGLRAKITRYKADYEKKLTDFAEAFKNSKNSKELSCFQSLRRQLEKLESKSAIAFSKLVDKLETYSDVNESELIDFEDWVRTYTVKLETLLEEINKCIDKLNSSSLNKRSDFGTFFKKQDPPQFQGDSLEYMEWKKRWESQVSSHSPPADFEIDLLKQNLPEEGRKKLYGCDSLSTAWRLLDKMYGDQKLIIQKLKSKLRNLKPKSKEPHEIVIELADEVEYLIKRLRMLEATAVLSIDNDFLNSVYKHLPEFHKLKWDDFDQEGYPNEWAAFMAFCHDIYNKAIQKRTRMESIREMELSSRTNIPSNPKVALVGNFDESPSVLDIKFEEKAEKFGNCKVCNSRHTYVNKFTKQIQPSDKFLNCESFKSLNKAERGRVVEQNNACRRCLSWSHDVSDCTSKVVSCKEKVNGVECTKDHSRLLCGSGIVYCLSVRSDDNIEELVPTFPLMEDVRVEHGTARLVYDNAAQRVLINNDFAKEQGLESENVIVNLELAGNISKRLETKIYHLNLIDNSGQIRRIWGYGCDKILTPYNPIDLRKVRHLFPQLPDCAFPYVPERRIDVLLGLNYYGLHPRGDHQIVENLAAERSLFSPSGWCIGGSHPLLEIKSVPQLTTSANLLRVALLQFYPSNVSVNDSLSVANEFLEKISVASVSIENSKIFSQECSKICSVRIDPMLTTEFWDADNLGVEPPRRCLRCRQCLQKGECSENHILLSLKDQAELDAINRGIQVKDGMTTSTWSFLKDPSCLGDNRKQVIATQSRLFNNLVKEGKLELYNDQILAGIESGLWSEISKEEMYSYNGPQNYITHHAIIKDSSSTPVRVVHNSSLKNGAESLNSILPRGPSQLNDMLAVTLRFRTYEECFGADLKKAYNTIRTGLVEIFFDVLSGNFHQKMNGRPME